MTEVERAHVAEPNEWWHAFLDSIDEVQTADVKPDTEPDWTTALVVRDKDGDHWGHDGENRWICLSYDDPDLAATEGFTNAALSMLGPITVIIDADRNNIEAEELGVELAQSRGKVRQLREQLAEAVRVRETTALDKESLVIALRNSRSAFARLELENARLQAQSGDGR